MSKTLQFVLISGILALGCAPALRADEVKPSPTPVSWELQTELTPPMRIAVDVGDGRGVRTYWYQIYTVTNNTGRDVPFNPEIVRVSEIENEVPAETATENPEQAPRLLVDPAMVGARPKLFRAIRNLHAKTHPFMTSPIKAIGPLLQGKDNARTSVAIFPDLDARVSRFTLHFSGLSGEKVTKHNPIYSGSAAKAGGAGKMASPEGGQPRYFVLRKTLASPYLLPGDVRTRSNAVPVLQKREWVMR